MIFFLLVLTAANPTAFLANQTPVTSALFRFKGKAPLVNGFCAFNKKLLQYFK
jgi:hypothetical protein